MKRGFRRTGCAHPNFCNPLRALSATRFADVVREHRHRAVAHRSSIRAGAPTGGMLSAGSRREL